MVEQGVDQRPVEISCGRMDDQTRRLVDHQQMLVLEHDLQRNFLRLVVSRRRLRNCDAKLFVAADLGCRVAERLARGFDGAAADQRLQSLARDRRYGAASARSRRQPAWAGSRRTSIV